MKNLNQIRAKNAIGIDAQGPDGGQVLKKIPYMLIENGLIATLSMAVERKKDGLANKGPNTALARGAIHCKELGLCNSTTAEGLLVELNNKPESERRAIANEMREFFGFARRLSQ